MLHETELSHAGLEECMPTTTIENQSSNATLCSSWRKCVSCLTILSAHSRLKWNVLKSSLEIVPSIVAINMLAYAAHKSLTNDDNHYTGKFNRTFIWIFLASIICTCVLEMFTLASTAFKFHWSHKAWVYTLANSVIVLLQIFFLIFLPIDGVYYLHVERSSGDVALLAFIVISKLIGVVVGFAHLAYLFPLCCGKSSRFCVACMMYGIGDTVVD